MLQTICSPKPVLGFIDILSIEHTLVINLINYKCNFSNAMNSTKLFFTFFKN